MLLKNQLKKSHIESLENDIFILQNVAPTFVRGYVRNYVKFCVYLNPLFRALIMVKSLFQKKSLKFLQ